MTPKYDWQTRHLVYLQTQLDRITRGEIDRLMVFMPPRHGKSEMTTIRYTAWRLEREPDLRVIVAAYNQTLANKFSRRIRRIVTERGVLLDEERTAVDDWLTLEGGGVRAAGVGAGITGMGANLIVIDDPLKSREEANSIAYRERVYDWYTDDLFTRREPGAAMILIQTRWHDDDLAGRILSSEQASKWKVVSLPAEAEDDDPLGRAVGEALWPARFDTTALSEYKVTSDWYALYQQRPQAAEGAIFKREWFHYVDKFPDELTSSATYWDTAYGEKETEDYSAAITVGRDKDFNYYVMPMLRERLEFPELVERARFVRRVWKTPVKVENKASGKSLVQALRKLNIPAAELDPGGKDKVARAHSITEWFAAGKVFFVRSTPDSLVSVLEDELLRFPSGKHDDLVDAMVMGLRNQTTTENKSPVVHDRGGFR